MSTASNPPRISRDIDRKHVTRMAAKGFSKGPVVGGEEVDVFVEAAGDEERA